MSFEEALKQLWLVLVPPLTPELRELAIQLWQKIKARKQRQPNRDSEPMQE